MPLSPPHGTAVGASTCGTAPLASRPLKLAGTARVRGDDAVLDSERRQQRRAMCQRAAERARRAVHARRARGHARVHFSRSGPRGDRARVRLQRDIGAR